MFICDISTVGATVHAWHVALHLGLAGVVSVGGAVFLTLGFMARRRAASAALTEVVEGRVAEGR